MQFLDVLSPPCPLSLTLCNQWQETTKQFLQTRSMLVITFYRDQASNLQKAAENASLVYNSNDSNLRIVTVDAAQGRL